jgi:uncharacterized protein (TIGR00159 family)
MEFISGIVPEIRWQDIVDILLNSYILFRLYILFRGTKTFRVLLGILLLWIFQRISVFMGLVITSWLLQAITAVAAIIIIVIFRNEIRSVFESTNLKSFFWGFSPKKISAPLDSVVEAIYEMAHRKIGALIVFPGNDNISSLVRNGIPLNGKVSRELILNIFWPDNPFHDGAAVVCGDRVTEVSAILPLTIRKDIPSHYGTRHRAALGLSENSDALVVVVSEERGIVSVARGSHIQSVREKAELKQWVVQQFGGETHRKEAIRKKERTEIAMAAAACFFIIFGIWFGFTRDQGTLITIDVPLKFLNQKPGMEILETSNNRIHLQLSGSETLLNTLRPDQINVQIDLGQSEVGKNVITLSENNIELPPGIKVKKITPNSVSLTLDFIVSRSFPVQVDWGGKLDETLILVEARLTPNVLKLTGGGMSLNEVVTIYTEKVMLNDIRQSGNLTVHPNLVHDSMRVSKDSPARIRVDYTVLKRNP